jgi:hypothetical protein
MATDSNNQNRDLKKASRHNKKQRFKRKIDGKKPADAPAYAEAVGFWTYRYRLYDD